MYQLNNTDVSFVNCMQSDPNSYSNNVSIKLSSDECILWVYIKDFFLKLIVNSVLTYITFHKESLLTFFVKVKSQLILRTSCEHSDPLVQR